MIKSKGTVYIFISIVLFRIVLFIHYIAQLEFIHLFGFIVIFLRLRIKFEAYILEVIAFLMAFFALRKELIRKIQLFLNIIAVVIHIVFTRRIQIFLIPVLPLTHMPLLNRPMLILHLTYNISFKFICWGVRSLPIIVISLPISISSLISSVLITILVSWSHLKWRIENIGILPIPVSFYPSSHLERSINIVHISIFTEETIVLFSKGKWSISISLLWILISIISLVFFISCSWSFSWAFSLPEIVLISSVSMIVVSIPKLFLPLTLDFSDYFLKLLIGLKFIEKSW